MTPTSEARPLTYKQRQARAAETAQELLERHQCSIREVPGGYRIKGPKADLLISDLQFLYEGDLR